MLMESNWSARNTDKKHIEGRRRNHRAMRIFIYARICPKTAKHLHTKLRLLKSKSGWPPSKHVECVYTRIYNSIQQLPFNISTYYSTLRAHKPIEWMRLLASSVPAFTCVAFTHTHILANYYMHTHTHLFVWFFFLFFTGLHCNNHRNWRLAKLIIVWCLLFFGCCYFFPSYFHLQ